MKLLKKSLACLLSVMLLLSCIPLSAAAAINSGTSVQQTTTTAGEVTVTVNSIDTADNLVAAIDHAIGLAQAARPTLGLTEANITKLVVKCSLSATDIAAITNYASAAAAAITAGTITPSHTPTDLTGLEVLDLSGVTSLTAITASQFAASITTFSSVLEEVVLPSGVITIGDDAFSGQPITTFNFSSLESLTTIGARAFQNTAFETLDLSGTALNSIGASAFAQTTPNDTLESVDLSGLKTIALAGAPNPVLNIGTQAFEGNQGLTKLDLTGSKNTVEFIAGANDIFDATYSAQEVKIVLEYTNYTKYRTATYAGSVWDDIADTAGTGTVLSAEFVFLTEPKEITATGTGSNQITFTWEKPDYIDSTFATIEYKVTLTNTNAAVTPNSKEYTYQLSDLTATTTGGVTTYSVPETDTGFIKNYNVYGVKVQAVATQTLAAGGGTVDGVVGVPEHDDYLDEVLVVPTEAEPVVITTDLQKGDHAFTENVTPTTADNLPDIVIDKPDNIISSGVTPLLTVGNETIQVADYGSLKYQWYYDTSDTFDITTATALTGKDLNNVSYTGTITSASGNTYTVPGVTPNTKTLSPGTYYFYVVFTNENPLAYDTTAQTTTTVTAWEKVRVRGAYDADYPIFTLDPVSAEYVLNETSEPLTAEAYAPDGGDITYSWLLTDGSLSNPTGVSSTNKDPNVYSTTVSGGPATDVYGTFVYYAEATNTHPLKANPTSWASAPAYIIVTPEHPVITDPDDQSYDIGDTTTAMSVTANAPSDGGTLSYQWYLCDDTDGTNPVEVVGATSDSYTPPATITDAAGTYYYYVAVTNTNYDGTGKKGEKTINSAVATITVAGVDAETPVLGSADYDVSVITNDTATLTAPAVSGVASTTAVITYQWYSCDADGTNGIAISGENGATYDPDTSAAGTYYYYVAVTNSDSAATGTVKSVTVNSDVYKLTVTDPLAVAETPVINTDPADADYETGDTATALTVSVDALTSPSAVLSYEWFSCKADGSDPVSVGKNATYTPDTSTAGDYYYYVVVTNTDSTATVTQTASATSGIAKITVTDPVPGVDAEEPVITTQPEEAKYDVNDAGVEALTVEANVTDGGTLSYQWYTCDADGSNAKAVTGANSASYTPDVSAEGTTYYYVVVTNTNTSATGSQTAEAKSDIVSVTVEKGYVAPTEYTVTFMDGEDELTDLAATVEEGETVAKPADPEKEGYVFKGWYTDEDLTEAYDFDEPVTEDLVLYAGWEEASTTHEPYVAGYDDGTFRPNASITRAEAAQMFYNILGYPDVDDVEGDYDGYPDVNDKGWYGAAVQVLSKMEVIKGDTDGNFRPNETITRAEFSSMVQLFYELADGDATKMPFTDVGSTHWARTAIAAVYEANIVVGTNDAGTLFEPNEDITRAQAVSMLNKAQGRYTNEEMWDGVKIPFSDVTTAHWGWTQIMEAAVEHEHPAATETETDAEE